MIFSSLSAEPDKDYTIIMQQDKVFLLYCPWCTTQAHIGITYLFSHLIISVFPVSLSGMRSFIFHPYCLYGPKDWLDVWVREAKCDA